MPALQALELRLETQSAINFIANHDVKAAAFPVLVLEGPLTTTGLANAVTGLYGVDAPCIKTYPDTYLKGGFASIERGPMHRGRPTRLFTATQTDSGLAAVGALVAWSDEFDMPLTRILSATASIGSRAPINTIQLLDGMLKGGNVGDITNSGYKKTKDGWGTQLNTRLKSLVETGLVTSEDKEVHFRILNPEYIGSVPFTSLHPNQQKVYEVLRKAHAIAPERDWVLSEIENLAQRFKLLPEGADLLRDFHQRLVRVISIKNPRYSPGATDKIELTGKKYTVSSDFQEAAAELVERVIQLDSSASARKSFTDAAKDMYTDSEKMRRVINRSLAHSPYIGV